jgi:hypothetical protein
MAAMETGRGRTIRSPCPRALRRRPPCRCK